MGTPDFAVRIVEGLGDDVTHPSLKALLIFVGCMDCSMETPKAGSTILAPVDVLDGRSAVVA